jgi:hypothetical protein
MSKDECEYMTRGRQGYRPETTEMSRISPFEDLCFLGIRHSCFDIVGKRKIDLPLRATPS